MEEWLERNPTANRSAQDIRPADDNSTIELFKYFTKMISGEKKDRRIYADALNQIFIAMKGRRVFQPIGFRKPKVHVEEKEKPTVHGIQDFKWDRYRNDWIASFDRIDFETGEIIEEKDQTKLSNYQPSEDFEIMLKEKVIYRKGQSWAKRGELPWSPEGKEVKASDAIGFNDNELDHYGQVERLKIPEKVALEAKENRLLKDRKIIQLELPISKEAS